MRNRQFFFVPKIQYELVAERSEANQNRLQFPTWWNYTTLLEPFLNGTDGALRVPNRTLGRAKRKGVGGKEFLPALAFPPPPNFVPKKLARRTKFLKVRRFSLALPNKRQCL